MTKRKKRKRSYERKNTNYKLTIKNYMKSYLSLIDQIDFISNFLGHTNKCICLPKKKKSNKCTYMSFCFGG